MNLRTLIRNNINTNTLSAVVVFGLSGCTSLKLTPDATIVNPQAFVDQQVTPPQDWVVPAPDALPETDWVRAFPDQILIELVDEALRKNSDIGVAYASLDAALALERIDQADRVPSLSATGGISRTERGNKFIPDNTSINAGLTASWEPDFWGRISDNIKTSQLEVEASASDVAAARLSICGQVASAWFSLIEARLLIDLSDNDLEAQKRALRFTELRYEAGLSGRASLRFIKGSVAQAEANRLTQLQNEAQLSRQLEILLRRYPANLLDAASDLPELPPLTGAGAPNYILTQRPDLIAAERRLAAQGIEIDLTRKALLPTLSLSGTADATGGGLESFFDVNALVANILANLTAPIFQGGRLHANIELQEAGLTQLLESYVTTVLSAYFDVENALYADGIFAEQEVVLREGVQEALAAEKLLEERFIEGLTTIFDLLDAQSRRISAEGQLISSRAGRLRNRVSLHVSLGGGTYGEVPQDALPAFLKSMSP